jgi:hypothetical protein
MYSCYSNFERGQTKLLVQRWPDADHEEWEEDSNEKARQDGGRDSYGERMFFVRPLHVAVDRSRSVLLTSGVLISSWNCRAAQNRVEPLGAANITC